MKEGAADRKTFSLSMLGKMMAAIHGTIVTWRYYIGIVTQKVKGGRIRGLNSPWTTQGCPWISYLPPGFGFVE